MRLPAGVASTIRALPLLLPLLVAVALPLAAHADPGSTTLPRLKPVQSVGPTVEAAWRARPLASRAASAAAALQSDPVMVGRAADALELVYRRDYPAARRQLDQLTADYPSSGIGPFGVALLYQALMFENYDFRYERQYELARDQAKAQLALGEKLPGDEAFEAFLLAGTQGIDAIHALRKGDYVTALGRAVDATRALQRTREQAPAFVDPALGEGMYLYWRTVASTWSPLVPSIGDRRADGIALLRAAEREAVFVGPAATLALAYAHLEEDDPRSAVDRCEYARAGYPDNVLNNLTLGRAQTTMGRLDDALTSFDRVLAVAPDNQRVHFLRGLVHARRGDWASARGAYERYLSFAEPPADLRGQAWYRLGLVYQHEKNYPKAEASFRAAIDVSGNELARGALRRMKRKGWAG